MINKNPLAQMISESIEHRLSTVHTSIPAKVVEYTPETQRATVEILLSTRKPIVVAVPVQQIGGSAWMIDIEVGVGDTGMVMFSERSMEEWLIDGDEGQPSKAHTFDRNDAVFIPGIRNNDNAYDGDNNGVVIRNHSGSVKLTLTTDGLDLNSGDLTVDGVSFLEHTHSYEDTGDSGTTPVDKDTGAPE